MLSQKVNNTAYNLLAYKCHLSEDGLRMLFPDSYEALIQQRAHFLLQAEALEAGAPAIADIRANVNLPVSVPLLPTHQPNPTQISFQIHKINLEIFNSFEENILNLKNFIKSLLSPEMTKGLTTKGGIYGIAGLSIPEMTDYFLSPKFSQPSMRELKLMEEAISAPFKTHLPLQENIDNMSKANINLGQLYPLKLLSHNAMYDLLFNEASRDSFDLKGILNEWTTKPDYNYETCTFDELADFLVTRNRDIIHSPLTNNLAFACESRYTPPPPNSRHPLAGAADGAQNPTPPATPATGLAAKGPPAAANPGWTKSNWKKFLKLTNPQPPTNALPAAQPPTVLGKLCFFHGWNLTHDSLRCSVMRNEPSFTLAQKRLVAYAPARDPPDIDGVPINTNVQRGCHAAT
jgi:hypothetical protein